MITVGQLLKKKGHDAWSVSPTTRVLDALKLMAEKNIGAVLILEDDRLAGIFSERDYARHVVARVRVTDDTQVKEIMTANVIYVRLEQTLDECMALMTEKHIRHLPVMRDDRVEGLISIGDVVKEIISEQEFTIHNLETYITGGKA